MRKNLKRISLLLRFGKLMLKGHGEGMVFKTSIRPGGSHDWVLFFLDR